MNEILQAILGGAVILIGFGAAVSYPRLQYTAARELRGVWRTLGLLPLAVMVVVGIVTFRALAQGANLWPILLIFTAPLATGYLLLLRFIERRLFRPGSDPRETTPRL